jgi:CheY-like chemotaxis protein
MKATRPSTALYIESSFPGGFLLVKRMICAAGFEVITVDHNGNFAEHLGRIPQLDLIVFDSNLVGFDGRNLAEEYYNQIKANSNTRHVPLIIISYENEKDMLDKLQADVHILKPIDPEEFIKILCSYLAK